MINSLEAYLPTSWQQTLKAEFKKDYMLHLRHFLESELKAGKEIYPHPKDFLAALKATPLEKVRVVILGQDPYHGEGQAHGMSFSVKKGVPIPPSLKNIFKEMERDLKIPPSSHGLLQSWGEQGVLLLNSVLSVEKNKAHSHQGKGWEIFTDKIVEILNQSSRPLIFLLWGAPAQKKALQLDQKKHFILKAPHPSPLSAYRGFLGCGHFSKTNQILQEQKEAAINWALPQD